MDAIESSVQADPSSQWIIIDDEMIKTLDTRQKVEKGMIGQVCFAILERFTKKTLNTN